MPRAASRPKTEQQTMQQATDFREESLTLLTLIADLDDVGFEQVTQFKSWTINDVIRHLHFWYQALLVSTDGEAAFAVGSTL